MSKELRQVAECEVCGDRRLSLALDLGSHPLCDDLVPVSDDRTCREYPIEVLLCEVCLTAHQRFQVPKHELFPRSYHYRSRFTADVLAGMAELVSSCARSFGPLSGKTVLDIGCNDGSLLDLFRQQGARTIGLEPTDAYRDAEQKGHFIINDFLSGDVARTILAAHGQPDFITFTNVFAHIEDLPGVLDSIRLLTARHTVIVIENHYLGAVLDGRQFDTFYHEHPRTYSCTSFVQIAKSLGISMLRLEFPARYGGNIRTFLGAGTSEGTMTEVERLTSRERRFPSDFARLREGVEVWRETKSRLLRRQVEESGPLLAKAFPGRAAILVKLLGLTENDVAAVFEKPGSLKIGHYVPGTRIPIRSDEELFAMQDQSQPILNLAWHIPNEIRSYLARSGYTGRVIDIVEPTDFTTQT